MTTSPHPRPFLVDIGNVICTFDFEPMLSALRERSDRVGADPLARFAETKDLYESGRWSDKQFVDHVMAEIGFRGERDDFEKLWTEVFEENQPMTHTINALAERGHPLYLLSNTNGLHLDYLRAHFPVFERFDGGIYSHEAGSIKPEEQIYKTAFETYSLDPAETLYIDDLPENIATGERLGLNAFQYDPTGHGRLLDWLGERGIELTGQI